jgi:GntR family transcriptional regulator
MAAKPALRALPGKLYVEMATLMRRRITSGLWLPGEQLPTIEALAREFAVAVVTIRQAIALLEAEGLVRRRQGKGTFVLERPHEKQLWLRMESNWESLIHIWEGSKPRSLKIIDTLASPPLEIRDGIPAPAYRYMRRVHRSKDIPYTVIDIYLDRRLYVKAPNKFDSQMVIPLLESLPGVEIKSARQTLSIGTADVETARLLRIPLNSPVGEVRRVLQDQNGVVIYLGEAIYRGDMVKLERVLTK